MPDRPDWDSYLMALAFVAATRSPDAESQHGAVVADHNHRVIGLGYNGFPRAGQTVGYPTRRPAKYAYMVHAELNAILNCALRPSLGTLYVTGLPCAACLRACIQSGISRIVYFPRIPASIDADEQRVVTELASNHGVVLAPFLASPAAPLLGALALLTASHEPAGDTAYGNNQLS